MGKINSPTLSNIARNSLLNGEVQIVIDDTQGNFHYLLSEQNVWERGKVPDLKKEIISLPASMFFEDKNDELFDITEIDEIRNEIMKREEIQQAA